MRWCAMKRQATALALFCAALTPSALWAETVGTVTRAQMDAYQATGFIGAGLFGGEDVVRDARIFTREFGSVQIRLIDNTDLLISPNSSIVIDDYVFAGGQSSRFAMSLTKGALRVISGRMPKPAQSVGTTIANIGVRGTTYWLDVQVPGILRIWVDDGAVVARPVDTTEDFVFEAPVDAECTTVTCYRTEAPPKPEKFPVDLRARGQGRGS